ncbi:MAG: hypothetical protein IJ874_07255 [Ruminococcus sp.]|nr:hypothetical protein [Ruminococcus sp.]
MDMKKLIAGIAALALASAMTGCGSSESSSSSESEAPTEAATEEATEEATEAPTEEETEPEPEPSHPVEASDPNTVDFSDGNFSFASPKTEDADSAQGTVEIVEVEGNPMLRFTDDGSNFANGTVQKIQIDAAQLLAPEDLAKVRSIELDIYADATSDAFEGNQVPGWLGGGGGANVAGDKWYDFGEWSGGEYNFEMSGAAHAEFKFLLAAGGQCWDETMTEATFLVMRWGAQNEGNLYIDNIVFYDEDGNSLPLTLSGAEGAEVTDEDAGDAEQAEDTAEEPAEDTAAEGEEAAEETAEDTTEAETESEETAE